MPARRQKVLRSSSKPSSLQGPLRSSEAGTPQSTEHFGKPCLPCRAPLPARGLPAGFVQHQARRHLGSSSSRYPQINHWASFITLALCVLERLPEMTTLACPCVTHSCSLRRNRATESGERMPALPTRMDSCTQAQQNPVKPAARGFTAAAKPPSSPPAPAPPSPTPAVHSLLQQFR